MIYISGVMSDIDRTVSIEKFTGTIIYVTKSGNDSNDGQTPDKAKLTITAAETAAGASGKIIVGPGTYAESVTLSEVGTELWGEIGTIITGTLTLGANSQHVVGMIVSVTAAVGIDLDGLYCKITSTNVVGTPTIGFDIDGAFSILEDCKVANHSTTGFDIAASHVHLYRCAAHGDEDTSRGFYVSSNVAGTCYFEGCSSIGNDIAGYEVTTGCSYIEFKNCSSGGGDGDRIDAGKQTVWSNHSPSQHERLFGGHVWYVNKREGDDNNSGFTPCAPFETIGAALSAVSMGDAINVKQGTYTETGLDLDLEGLELWSEIGVVIDPPSGSGLSVTANYCKITGHLVITPSASNTGLSVGGSYGHYENITITGGDYNFNVSGQGCVFKECIASVPSDTSYRIRGQSNSFYTCRAAGIGTGTSGYVVLDSKDYCVFDHCSSLGHGATSYAILSGSGSCTLTQCSSGAGDGRWKDIDHGSVWAEFEYDDEVNKITTFSGSGTSYSIFNLTGAVRISEIFGTVETVMPNTSSTVHLQLRSEGQTVDITDVAGPNVQNAVEGTILIRNAPSDEPLGLGNPDGTPAIAENVSWKDPKTAIDCAAADDADTIVRVVFSAALASGAIDWHCHWEPISDDGFLSSA